MSTIKKAEHEFTVLEKTVGETALILPFKKEMLRLVDKFGASGQSGGSAPYVAWAITQALEKLLLQNPICPITGIDEEWNDVTREMGRTSFQNNRLSSVFKDGKDGKPYYLEAIVFEGDIGGRFTSNGSVVLKDGSVLTSRQSIKGFPFVPKTFYVDVIVSRFDKDRYTGKLTPNPDGDWWEYEIKDEAQLAEALEYYDRKHKDSTNQ